ncbi:MAG: immunoglobulin domain-containing protein [Flavobacteriales bacterium]|nr:MAG: T9SS type A sorting domain-containing protein [Bacteroidota bacterium]KXK35007.1 MAG: Immunoglobulin I-set domain protein [Chlorobi bacterium OLB6]MBE2266489.1 immunoglobulin domain-containing protein [Flavobacteriales bacterium]MBV6464046.1 hypothetical protein [Chlorobiota bacterium]MBW7853751.1 immunoglobulin domain-containing protein [Candidatus Kapabacteria bacterium]MCC6331543.1 immunoglobulin domain-containing protein [Ignavibacteria bacterium]
MQRSYTVLFAISLVFLLSNTDVFAYRDGIIGVYKLGCAGAGCHVTGQGTQITLTGSTTVLAQSNNNFTIRVAHQTLNAAGVNLAVEQDGQTAGELTAGDGLQGLNNELTHAAPAGFRNKGANFSFSWRAPANHGIYTLYAAGAAVNLDNTSAGDAFTTYSTDITVKGATFTNPMSGMAYCGGEVLVIRWTQTAVGAVRIEMSDDDFENTILVERSVEANLGSYSYTLPDNVDPSNSYQLRLVEVSTSTEVGRSQQFSISDKPVIVSQPQSQDVCEGQAFELVAGVIGKDPVYRWKKNGDDIPGATLGVYNIPSCNEADQGTYTCVITSCGVQLETTPAEVTIKRKPHVVQATTGPIDTCEGASVSLQVQADGSSLRYQWYKNGVLMPEQETSVLEFPSISLFDDAKYFCIVSGACEPSDTSDPVQITVLNEPQITLHPASAAVTVGERIDLMVNASGKKLRYQWYKNGKPIPGATEKLYSIAKATQADAGKYHCEVSNVCDTVQSQQSTVTINGAPGSVAVAVTELSTGDIGICTGYEVELDDVISNIGQNSITITAVETTPSAVIEVQGLQLPHVLNPGEYASISVAITPATLGKFSGTITIVTTDGTATINVKGAVVSDLQFTADTLYFATGVPGTERTAQTFPLECDSATVLTVDLGGSGKSSFEIAGAFQLPQTLKMGDVFTVQVRTTSETNATAFLVVSSTAGADTVYLTRGEVNSVTDELYLAGITMAPNPMSSEVTFMLPEDTPTRISIYDVLGRLCTSLAGTGVVRWDGLALNGKPVPNGLYLVNLEYQGKAGLLKLIKR